MSNSGIEKCCESLRLQLAQTSREVLRAFREATMFFAGLFVGAIVLVIGPYFVALVSGDKTFLGITLTSPIQLITGNEGAAWVQAFGSIVALAIAVWLPGYTKKVENRAEEKRFMSVVQALADRSLERVNFTICVLSDPNIWMKYGSADYESPNWGDGTAIMAMIPIANMPGYDAVEDFAMVRKKFGACGKLSDQVLHDISSSPTTPPNPATIKKLIEHRNEMKVAVENLRKRLESI